MELLMCGKLSRPVLFAGVRPNLQDWGCTFPVLSPRAGAIPVCAGSGRNPAQTCLQLWRSLAQRSSAALRCLYVGDYVCSQNKVANFSLHSPLRYQKPLCWFATHRCELDIDTLRSYRYTFDPQCFLKIL